MDEKLMPEVEENISHRLSELKKILSMVRNLETSVKKEFEKLSNECVHVAKGPVDGTICKHKLTLESLPKLGELVIVKRCSIEHCPIVCDKSVEQNKTERIELYKNMAESLIEPKDRKGEICASDCF